MNALPLMLQASEMFRERLVAEPGCTSLPMPHDLVTSASVQGNLRWNNVLLRANSFRRAHLETFDVPGRLSVLHVCVFPHLDDPAPIFGFDMIAGPSRVTGIFLDLSPVTGRVAQPSLTDVVGHSALADFAIRRELPDWGDIFSDDMLAIRPVDLHEVSQAIRLAQEALDGVFSDTSHQIDVAPADIESGQVRYVLGQRRNEHTLRMLTSFVGSTLARRFIDEILFPLDENVAAFT